MPSPDQVRGFNIRHPERRDTWIADQVRNDSNGCNDTRGDRDDPQLVMPDSIRHPVRRDTWIADQVRNDTRGDRDDSNECNDTRGDRDDSNGRNDIRPSLRGA